jgi:beta-phosphoglucomutase-like phosphatase (HAD superfamily)
MSKENIAEQEQEPVSSAILFELENISFDGRDVMYGVIEKTLAAKGIVIKPFTFSRYALNVSLTQFIETIIEVNKKRLDATKLVTEIEGKLGKALLKKASDANGDLKKMIKMANKNDVAVGALSVLEDATAKELLEKLGAGEVAENLLCSNHRDRCCHSADAWLKLAKNMTVPASKCLVLATCRASCKSALKAGMRCVVLPDDFTSFQDFGGADMVATELSGTVMTKVFKLLEDE